MTRYRLLGIFACIGGAVLLGFQAISGMLGTKTDWKRLSAADVIGQEHFAWLPGASLAGLESAGRYVLDMPLYILLFCLGGLLFIIDYFLGRR